MILIESALSAALLVLWVSSFIVQHIVSLQCMLVFQLQFIVSALCSMKYTVIPGCYINFQKWNKALKRNNKRNTYFHLDLFSAATIRTHEKKRKENRRGMLVNLSFIVTLKFLSLLGMSRYHTQT